MKSRWVCQTRMIISGISPGLQNVGMRSGVAIILLFSITFMCKLVYFIYTLTEHYIRNTYSFRHICSPANHVVEVRCIKYRYGSAALCNGIVMKWCNKEKVSRSSAYGNMRTTKNGQTSWRREQ